MTTNFLMKSGWKWIVFAVTLGVTFGAFAYAKTLSTVETVALNAEFYYLVSEDMQMEAGAEFVRLDGGAGYLLTNGDEEYVALSVYLKERDGVTVLENLKNNGKTGRILGRKVDKLYLKTTEQKKQASLYQGAFQSLYGCMQVLEECIFRLEKGMTQESCKRLLNTLKKQVVYLEKEYEGEFEKCASVCKEAKTCLTEMVSNTVYLKDLRYLACFLAEEYVSLANVFSL